MTVVASFTIRAPEGVSTFREFPVDFELDDTPVSVTGDLSVLVSGTYLVDATSGPVVLSLPAAGRSAGMRLTVRKVDSTANAVTLDPANAELIDTEATLDVSSAIELVCDSTKWWTISSTGGQGEVFTPQTFSVARAQAAIDADGILNLGKGTFDLGTSSLTVDTGVKIIGDGFDTTTITYSGTGTAIVLNTAAAGDAECTLRDFRLNGPSPNGSTVGISAGLVSGSPISAQVFAMDIRVSNFGTGLLNIAAIACGWYNCRFDLNGLNMDTDTVHQNNNNSFYNCKFRTATGVGVRLSMAINWNFYSCLFEQNAEEGFLIESTGVATTVNGIFLRGCYFESNNTSRVGTGVSEFRAEATSTGFSKNVFLDGTYWSTNDAADYYIWKDNSEEVYNLRDIYTGEFRVFQPSTGTPPRIYTPMRQVYRFFNAGNQELYKKIYDQDDGDTRLSAYAGDIIVLNNTSPTSVNLMSDFLLERGDTVEVWVRDTNTTIVHTATGAETISTDTGANIVVAAPTWFRFILEDDGQGALKWFMIGNHTTG